MTETIEARRDSSADAGERFNRESANHKMTVLHDDGLYRHIRFMNPEYSAYWFELITVPNALIFRSDGDSFVFSRIKDMFQFFRSDLGSDRSIHVNPGYWSEKLNTDHDNVMKYSQDLFNQQVAEALREAEEDYPGVSAAWDEKVNGFLAEYNTEYEVDARAALDDFEFGTIHRASCVCGASQEFTQEHDATLWRSKHLTPENAGRAHGSSVDRIEGFRFTDTWEWQLKDYHWWFLWACHAIVWGIAQFDAACRDGGDT